MKTSLLTPRLILKQPNPETLEALRPWFKNPEIMRYQGGIQNDEQINKILLRIQTHWTVYGFGHFLIFLKDNPLPIGLVSLKYLNDDDAENKIPDLGFILCPEFWRQGFVTEAAQALLKYANEELGFKKIQAFNYPENSTGTKTLLKLGFQQVGQKEVITYGRNFGTASQWEVCFDL